MCEVQETRDTYTVENKQIQPWMTSYIFRRFQFKAVDSSTNMRAWRRRFQLQGFDGENFDILDTGGR